MAAASPVGAECHAMLSFLSDIDARWPARMERECGSWVFVVRVGRRIM
jgi:hypothetical protein